ncbi:MAG: hypothetical protein HPY82_12830 [Gammaproteobacteria bacterium]|nr:hypothetical protein [Gammaproteobacteria bacterium]
MESRRDMAGIWPGRTWIGAVVSLFLGLWLTACGGGGGGGGHSENRGTTEPMVVINGQVALDGQSMEGAAITLSRIDVARTPISENVKGQQIVVDLPEGKPTVGSQGDLQFQVPASALVDDQLYSVTVACLPVRGRCSMQMPVHVVLSGARLQQGGWKLNVPTEVAYQRLAYYVAARFNESDLKQEMDTTAKLLLKADVDGSGGIDYEDLIQWDPLAQDADNALLRPANMVEIGKLLLNGAGVNALYLKTQSALSATLGSLTLGERGGKKVLVYGSFAYVGMDGMGVQVFDIRDPLNPVHVSTLLDSLPANDFVVHEGYAYIVNYTALHIYDVHDPANPVRLYNAAQYFAEHGAYKIQAEAGYAYICKGDIIQVVDIRNPLVPVISDEEWRIPCKDLVVRDGVAIVSHGPIIGEQSVDFYKLNGPNFPVRIGGMDFDGENNGVCVDNGRVYVLKEVSEGYGYTDQLGIVDLTVSGDIYERFSYPLPTYGSYSDLFCRDGRVQVLSLEGVTSVNLRDLTNPIIEPFLNLDVENNSMGQVGLRSVFSQGKYLYVAGTYLKILSDIGGAVPLLQEVTTNGAPIIGAAKGNLLYCMSNALQLNSTDFSTTAWPVELGRLDLAPTTLPFGLWLDGSYLYGQRFDLNTFETSYWYSQVDPLGGLVGYSKIDFPLNIKSDPRIHGFIAFYVKNSVGYVADETGLNLFGMEDPSAPVLEGRVELGSAAVAMTVADGFAYLRGLDGLQVVDVRNVRAPRLVASIALQMEDYMGFDVEYFNHHLFLTTEKRGVVIVDVNKPDAPRVVRSLPTTTRVQSLQVAGQFLYMASSLERNGVEIASVADPSQPLMLGEARTKGAIINIALGSSLLFALTSYGVEILPLLPAN